MEDDDHHRNRIDSLPDNAVTIVFYYVFEDVYHINCMLPVIRALSKKWYEVTGGWMKKIEEDRAMLQWTDTDLKKQLNCAMQCGFEALAFLPSREKLERVLIDDIESFLPSREKSKRGPFDPARSSSRKKTKRMLIIDDNDSDSPKESELIVDDNDSSEEEPEDIIRAIHHQNPRLGIAWAAIVRNDTDLLSRSRAVIRLCPLQNVIISKWWNSEEPRINLYETYSNIVSPASRPFRDYCVHFDGVREILRATMKDSAARGEEGRMRMCYAQFEILDETDSFSFDPEARAEVLETKLIRRKEVLTDAGNAARERGETECLHFCTTEITKSTDRLEAIRAERAIASEITEFCF